MPSRCKSNSLHILNQPIVINYAITFHRNYSLLKRASKSFQVFLVSNLTLSCLFLIYLLFYILRHENKYRSRSNDGSRWRKLRQLPSNIRYLFGKDRIARLSRKDQVLNHEAFDINMNEQKTELTPARNTRDYSICSNASSVGIDLGLLRKNSSAQDNSSSDKDVYISTRFEDFFTRPVVLFFTSNWIFFKKWQYYYYHNKTY